MSEAKLESTSDGRFRVIGAMNFETAVSLLRQSEQMFGQREVSIDFAAVTDTDSAGLALLIEWIKQARAANRRVALENLPQQLLALARISEVDEMLGLASGTSNDVPAPVRQSVG